MIADVLAGRARWAIEQGDGAELLGTLPVGCAQLVLTDPPYNIGIPYPDYDDRQPWDAYWAMADRLLDAVHRALRPGGVFAALLPFTAFETVDGPVGHNPNRRERRKAGLVLPLLAEWTHRAEGAGLLYEDTIAVAHAFDKEGGEAYAASTAIGGARRPHMRVVCRALLVCFKDERRLPDAETADQAPLGFHKNLWYCRPAWGDGRGHPTPMPPEAAHRAIRLWSSPGDLVVDTCVGSGTVVAEARREGRRAIGFDVSPTSVAIARRRQAQAVLPLAEVGG